MESTLRPPLAPAEAEELLNHRFRLTDRRHPAIAELYAFTSSRLTASEQIRLDEVLQPPVYSPEKLEELFEAAQSLPSLEPLDLLRPEMQLPALPNVLFELQNVMQRENSTAEQAANVVLKDLSLSAWLLRLVNSAYYGFPGRIETVSRAVALLGFRQMQSVVSSGILQTLVSAVRATNFNRPMFWRHNIAVALLASEIWRMTKRPDAERLFVAGQLHDIGKLTLACTAPEHCDVVWTLNEASSGLQFEQEQHFLGFDHAILGGVLLRKWNMPVTLVMAALRHHDKNTMEKYPETAAVHVADVIAHAVGISAEPVNTVPPLAAEAWASCGIQPEAIPALLATLYEHIDTLSELMNR